MDSLRTSLHLALALTLTSLTCGLGALCAGMGESCCCIVEDGGSPCQEMSGGHGAPISPEQDATFASGDWFSVAVLEAAPAVTAPDAAAALPMARSARVPAAAATPLFLSHCAFLC
jgi:hypothetical protein